ncbi:hypothetical protein NMG60_11008879 [Bertholletia excelsa]
MPSPSAAKANTSSAAKTLAIWTLLLVASSGGSGHPRSSRESPCWTRPRSPAWSVGHITSLLTKPSRVLYLRQTSSWSWPRNFRLRPRQIENRYPIVKLSRWSFVFVFLRLNQIVVSD